MKLKAVVSPNLPVRLVRSLVHPGFNTWYIETVVVGCLHVSKDKVTPATHYVQHPDFLVEWEDGSCGIEVSFSKLSATFSRSALDFENARRAVFAKFKELIGANLSVGRHCWLFVGTQTDKPIEKPGGGESTLIEIPEYLVPGLAEPDPEGDRPASEFFHKAWGYDSLKV